MIATTNFSISINVSVKGIPCQSLVRPPLLLPRAWVQSLVGGLRFHKVKINKALIDFKIEKYKDIKIKDLDLYEKYLISFIRLSLRDLKILLIDNIFNSLSEEESLDFIGLIKDVFLSKNITTIVVSDTYSLVSSICSREIHFVSGSIEGAQ